MRGKQMDRRSFLNRTAGIAAGALAFPAIVPGAALGLDGIVAPSERIAMGCIGVGGRGTDDMRGFLERADVRVVAVCDVDTGRRLQARQIVEEKSGGGGCAEYGDYRELLARPDLDAVLIATPDHWHALPAIAAAQRGLDVYGEKPLSLTIAEGRAMSDAVARHGIVWQTGSQQRSDWNFRYGCELVRNGRIGEVKTVEVCLHSGSPTELQPAMPVPEGLDYDMWLGQAPWAPYTDLRTRGWREFFDYSGGILTDWGAHMCDIAQWGMGTDHTGPVEIEGRSEFPTDGLYDTASHWRFECKYAEGFTMIVADRKHLPVPPGKDIGVKFIGSEGWVQVSRGRFWTEPESLARSVIRPDEIHLYESNNHIGNFIDCIRTRRPTAAPVETAHRSISIAHLGNLAMRLEQRLEWDPAREKFRNSTEANAMLSRPMRSPWRL